MTTQSQTNTFLTFPRLIALVIVLVIIAGTWGSTAVVHALNSDLRSNAQPQNLSAQQLSDANIQVAGENNMPLVCGVDVHC